MNPSGGHDDIKSPRSAGALSGSPPFSPNVSDQELQAWLNPRGDDLSYNVDFDDIDLMDDEDIVGLQSNNNNPEDKFDPRVRTISVNSDNNRNSPADFDRGELSITLTAEELQRRCKGDYKDSRKITICNILGDKAPIPCPPEPPAVSYIL